ncbi:hypothetical protein [Nonomuraea longicatena]|uniref:Uncharacterized protein n=1 Tax=Nonomuraea longicatena TaxID=83682 RepID=A0ABN1Q760_9ACTN
MDGVPVQGTIRVGAKAEADLKIAGHTVKLSWTPFTPTTTPAATGTFDSRPFTTR